MSGSKTFLPEDSFLEKDAELIRQTARLRYSYDAKGQDPDLFQGTNIFVAIPYQRGEAAVMAAKERQARLNLATLSMTRLALLRDISYRGGVIAPFARAEEHLSAIVDRAYLGPRKGSVLRSDGLIDQIRSGIKPDDGTNLGESKMVGRPTRTILRKGQAALLQPGLPLQVNRNAGITTLGHAQLPGSAPLDTTYPSKAIGMRMHPTAGYVLSAPEVSLSGIAHPVGQSPQVGSEFILMGHEIGTKVTVGREEVMAEQGALRTVTNTNAPGLQKWHELTGDSLVSRQHVQFEITPVGMLVTDLSTNGTAVEHVVPEIV